MPSKFRGYVSKLRDTGDQRGQAARAGLEHLDGHREDPGHLVCSPIPVFRAMVGYLISLWPVISPWGLIAGEEGA